MSDPEQADAMRAHNSLADYGRDFPIVHDHGDRWDTGDVEALLFLRQLGEPWDRVAKILGRTINAARSKFYREARKGEGA